MTFNEFTEEVRDGLNLIFDDEEVSVSVGEVVKNNGLVLTGINIRENGADIIPTIYIDDYYREDMDSYDISEVVSKIKQVYTSRCKGLASDNTVRGTDKYKEFDWVKDKVVYTLVNLEMNKQLLKTIPYIPFHDLAIIFRCVFHKGEKGIASSIVSKNDMKKWNVDTKTLLSMAIFNTPRIFPSVIEKITAVLEERAELPEHILEEIMGDVGEMYVLTNSSGINGAAALLYDNILDECSRIAGGNIYILPSSIHELIFINENMAGDAEELAGIVKDVNDNVVNRTELLSYSVYYYNCHRKKLTLVAGCSEDEISNADQ